MTGQKEIASAIEAAGNNADAVLACVEAAGYVCVPREPTPEMIEAAWAEALDENAVGVWRDMIAAYEGRRTV